MIRPGHVLAAAAAAAITYRVTRAHPAPLRPHVVAAELSQITAAVAGASDGAEFSVEDRLAADEICDGLQDRNWTAVEQEAIAVVNRLMADREGQ
jgi:hypothetical protein